MPLRKKSSRTKLDQKKDTNKTKLTKGNIPKMNSLYRKKRKTSTAFGSLNDFYFTKSTLPARNDIGKMEYI